MRSLMQHAVRTASSQTIPDPTSRRLLHNWLSTLQPCRYLNWQSECRLNSALCITCLWKFWFSNGITEGWFTASLTIVSSLYQLGLFFSCDYTQLLESKRKERFLKDHFSVFTLTVLGKSLFSKCSTVFHGSPLVPKVTRWLWLQQCIWMCIHPTALHEPNRISAASNPDLTRAELLSHGISLSID